MCLILLSDDIFCIGHVAFGNNGKYNVISVKALHAEEISNVQVVLESLRWDNVHLTIYLCK